MVEMLKRRIPVVQEGDERGQADLAFAHELPHADIAPVHGARKPRVDQLLLVIRLPPGELEEPRHRDVKRVAREQNHRFRRQFRILPPRLQAVPHRALVAVPAVRGGETRDRRVGIGQGRVAREIALGDAVALRVKPREHHLEPGIAALGMGDDDERGPPRDIQLQRAEPRLAGRDAQAGGQHCCAADDGGLADIVAAEIAQGGQKAHGAGPVMGQGRSGTALCRIRGGKSTPAGCGPLPVRCKTGRNVSAA